MNRRNVTRPRRSGPRTKVRTERKGLRRWFVLTSTVFGSMLCILAAYQHAPSALAGLITIQQVAVSGLDHLPRREVLSLLDLPADSTLLSIDREDMERKVEVHPWVADATVGRLLPHTLTVRVIERKPSALFRHAGGELVLDEEGVVLSIASGETFHHLPVLSGLNVVKLLEGDRAQSRRIRDGILAARLVQQRGGSDVRVVLDHPRFLEVVTKNEVFQFGEDVQTSWQRYVALQPTIKKHGRSETGQEIDLRYAGRVIVR